MISSGCINWTILHLNVLDYFAYVFNETNNNQSRRLIHTFSIPGAIFVFPLAYNMLTFMAASILELLTDNLIFLCSLYSPSLSLLYFPGLFTEEIDTSNQTLHRILFLLDNFTRGIVNMGPTNWDLWYQNRQEKIRKCIFISNIKIRCTRVMPLSLIFVSDTFPILPLAIIFHNQSQRQNGTPRK